jgi:hypothetical protein
MWLIVDLSMLLWVTVLIPGLERYEPTSQLMSTKARHDRYRDRHELRYQMENAIK